MNAEQQDPMSDPLTALREALERIDLLERQVRMLMTLSDVRVQNETDNPSFGYAWPRKTPSKNADPK